MTNGTDKFGQKIKIYKMNIGICNRENYTLISNRYIYMKQFSLCLICIFKSKFNFNVFRGTNLVHGVLIY